MFCYSSRTCSLDPGLADGEADGYRCHLTDADESIAAECEPAYPARTGGVTLRLRRLANPQLPNQGSAEIVAVPTPGAPEERNAMWLRIAGAAGEIVADLLMLDPASIDAIRGDDASVPAAADVARIVDANADGKVSLQECRTCLEGQQCLVFFLGGLPNRSQVSSFLRLVAAEMKLGAAGEDLTIPAVQRAEMIGDVKDHYFNYQRLISLSVVYVKTQLKAAFPNRKRHSRGPAAIRATS